MKPISRRCGNTAVLQVYEILTRFLAATIHLQIVKCHLGRFFEKYMTGIPVFDIMVAA